MVRKSLVFVLLGSLLLVPRAFASIVTLKHTYPILGVSTFRVATHYDPENFTGFFTQGIQYLNQKGTPFVIHYDQGASSLAGAMWQHEQCRVLMVHHFLQVQHKEPKRCSSPEPKKDELEEIYELFDIMSPQPEEMENLDYLEEPNDY